MNDFSLTSLDKTMKETTETLDEFIARAKSELDDFATSWRNSQKKFGADMYPAVHEPGEWDEQVRSYFGG